MFLTPSDLVHNTKKRLHQLTLGTVDMMMTNDASSNKVLPNYIINELCTLYNDILYPYSVLGTLWDVGKVNYKEQIKIGDLKADKENS